MPADRPPTEPFLRTRFDRFEIDEADARLTNAGEPIPLAPKPFAVLCALARSPRKLVTKDTLLDTVWGHRFVTESVLKSTISELRGALGDDPKMPRFIETVARRGYRFIAPLHAGAALSARSRRRQCAGATACSVAHRWSAARASSSGCARHGGSRSRAGTRPCGSPAKPASERRR